MKSVLQDWVMELGLRHQGVLLSACRGCDTAPKNDSSKNITRAIRGVLLNAHSGDAKKAQTYIEHVETAELIQRFNLFRKNLDHYPHHYVMHFIHTCEIIGYKHHDAETRKVWTGFYLKFCDGLHMNPESESELDKRLNADEDTFGKKDKE